MSEEWNPILNTGELQISLYAWGNGQEALEIRDATTIYIQLTPEQTADLVSWIEKRDQV